MQSLTQLLFLARDRQITEVDTNITQRKLTRAIKDMQNAVHMGRWALDNAVRGNKQNLRNTLSEHKELQLAYQNSQPQVF